MASSITLIIHNVRSCHNVGSMLRSADGLGVKEVIMTGYTPYPTEAGDVRLPHLAAKIDAQIRKVALGAEKSVRWRHESSLEKVITALKSDGFFIAVLEQHPNSVELDHFKPGRKVALVVGPEVDGLGEEVVQMADIVLSIPMRGSKESFNVSVAAAIGLYQLTR